MKREFFTPRTLSKICFVVASMAVVAMAPRASAEDRQGAANWDGGYLGAFAGWRGHDPSLAQQGGSLYTLPDPGQNGAGNDLTADTSAPGVFGSAAEDIAHGVSAGAYAGYSVSRSRLVFGVEGDFGGGSAAEASATAIGTIAGVYDTATLGSVDDTASAAGTQALGAKSKTAFDGSVRARIGVLVTPSVMIFGSGGVAFANFDRSATVSGSVTFTNEDASTGTHTFSGAQSSTGWDAGWTIGSGVEASLSEHWSLRAEYRYSRFGAETVSVPISVTAAGAAPAAPADSAVNVRFQDSIHSARIGVSYRF